MSRIKIIRTAFVSLSIGIALTACQTTAPAAQTVNLLGVASQVTTQSFKVLGQTVKNSTSSTVRTGNVVSVTGAVQSDGSVSANSITVDTEIKAAISSIDVANSTLVVLGQTVKADANTVFENSSSSALTLNDLKIGDFVEVSGLRQSDGSLLATRIELEAVKPVGNHLHGTATALDATTKTFKVGNQVVDYSNATVTGTLAESVRVEVKGALNTSGVLVATKVEVLAHGKTSSHSDGQFEIEGLSSGLDATAKTIVVQNYTVHFDAAAITGTPANDSHVEVHGSLNSDGSIAATKIDFEGEHHGGLGDADAMLVGSITALDATAKTIAVDGVVYNTDANTVLENNDAHIAFTDLKVSDQVEIKFVTASKIIRKLEIGSGHSGSHH